MRQVRLLTMFAALVAAVVLGMPRLAARQVPPGPPSNLNYVVSPGGGVSLQWTHSTGTFTQYILEAGVVPGSPFLRLPMPPDGLQYGKMPEVVPAFAAAGIGAGDYYVRIRGANGAAESAPSNEVLVPIRAGCVIPGTPTDFTAIMRGDFGLLQWNPGDGGRPTTYLLLASTVPGLPSPQFVIPLGTPHLTTPVPPGTWYVRMAAANACGTSAPSPEVSLTSPSNSPARTPDPAPGRRLPQPNVRDLVFQFAAEAIQRNLLDPNVACPTRSGTFTDDTWALEARKTQPNAYINYIVDRLRQIDTRFGYNAKPTRAWVPSIIAGDEIAYHYGAGPSEGSPDTYAVDVLGGHCTGVGGISGPNRHTPDYRPFYNEFVRWTGAGRF